jgi:hypothetical protein
MDGEVTDFGRFVAVEWVTNTGSLARFSQCSD